MDCFNNRIGILGCDAPASEAVEASGVGITPVVLASPALPILYINSLPGITLENIGALGDSERETFLDVWKSVAFRALKKFEVLLRAKIGASFCIYDTDIVNCLMCENIGLFDVALWYLHGTELMIERTSTDALNRFTTIDFEKAERLKGEFFGEFQTAFDDAALSMNTTDSDCVPCICIPSEEPVRFVFQIP